MEFINKTNQIIFHPYYIRFENNKWNAISNNYGAYNYDGFNSAFKNTIKELLIEEQNNLCCYCMKFIKITDSISSIEHLYPNNPQPHNIFVNYGVTCIEKILFDFTRRQVPNALLDNLPHDVSYYNLVACCISCNNTRDTKEIRSFVFDPNVKNEFSYNDNGNIFSSLYQDEITKIDLANDRHANYRRLWKHIAITNNHTIFSNENKLKRAIIKAALELHLKTKSFFYADFMLNGIKVNEAIMYRYFFDN
jgi:hypothetical protein